MYGAQTNIGGDGVVHWFENDVEMYGAQTRFSPTDENSIV